MPDLKLMCCNALGHREDIRQLIAEAFKQGALWASARDGEFTIGELDEASEKLAMDNQANVRRYQR